MAKKYGDPTAYVGFYAAFTQCHGNEGTGHDLNAVGGGSQVCCLFFVGFHREEKIQTIDLLKAEKPPPKMDSKTSQARYGYVAMCNVAS